MGLSGVFAYSASLLSVGYSEIIENTWFLNRSPSGSHLNSIGWSDSPVVENRFRAFALPLLTGAATPSQQNLAGNTGDYEEHKILGESGSRYSRGGIRRTD
jgi:hypothetical protein